MNDHIVLQMLLFAFGLLFILVSGVEYFFPSKSRNQKGYRTKRSLYTQESWDFAQKYYAKIMFRCSIFLIVLSFVTGFFRIPDITGAILFAIIIMAICFFIYFKTEKALRDNF